MLKVKVLVIDDDKNLCKLLEFYLKKYGYQVLISNDGVDGVNKFTAERPDLVILDIMLPRLDGWGVCSQIRNISRETPIIMLTAKGEKYDKIKGLDIGADYYLVKPFDAEELMAQVKAILRRTRGGEVEMKLEFPGLVIDKKLYQVQIDGENIDLTPKEFDLLWFLANNSRKVFTRQQLLDKVWGIDFFGDDRTVDTHVKKLRNKIERKVKDINYIHTVWGVGYKFQVEQK